MAAALNPGTASLHFPARRFSGSVWRMEPARLRLLAGAAVFCLLCLGLSAAALVQVQSIRTRNALLEDEVRAQRDNTRVLQGQADQLRRKLDERASLLESKESLLQSRESQLAAAEQARLTLEQERAARLLKEKQQEAAARSMLDKLSAVLRPEDATVSVQGGRLTIRLANQILFRSGEARLRAESRAVLAAIATLLNTELAGATVTVEGHTDNIPISDAMRPRFPSNWELSAARAGAAVQFLATEGGVDPARLVLVGRGETRPMADNATAEGQAANRRIEFQVDLSEAVPVRAPAVGGPAPSP